MISQFDVVSDNAENYYIVISNNLVNGNSSKIWSMPIKKTPKEYVTDITLFTKRSKMVGVIDTTLIKTLDLNVVELIVVDHAQPRVHNLIIEAIEAHTEIL